jgi:hypothetical protein
MIILMIFSQYRRKLDFIPAYICSVMLWIFKKFGCSPDRGAQGRGNAEDAGFGLSDGE